MGSFAFKFITLGLSLYITRAQNIFSQPSNTLDTNQDASVDQSMKGLTFFQDNPLFNDSLRYLNPSGENVNSLPGWQSMIPHFIPHHVKIAHILMNRNKQTDTTFGGSLGDIPVLPAKEGIFVGGDPSVVKSNDTSNIPVVSFKNAFQRNEDMPDNQMVGNGQQFFRGSQNDMVPTSSMFGVSSIQSDSSMTNDQSVGEIKTSLNTVGRDMNKPSMQPVSFFDDNKGKPQMRSVAEFVDTSDTVAMRQIGDFQDQSNKDSTRKEMNSSPTDFATNVINKDAPDIFRSPSSDRSRTTNDGTKKPHIDDIVFPTLRSPVNDADSLDIKRKTGSPQSTNYNLPATKPVDQFVNTAPEPTAKTNELGDTNFRLIDRPSMNPGDVFNRGNGVSGMNINEQSSSSKINAGGIPISPESAGTFNFNLPDGQQVIDSGGVIVPNTPAKNNVKQTVASNFISVPVRSPQTQVTQDMNKQQIASPKRPAPVIEDGRVGPSNMKNAINANGSFGSVIQSVNTQKMSGGPGVDFGIDAISAVGDETNKSDEGSFANTDVNTGKPNLNGFVESTVVLNANRQAVRVNGINQGTIGGNGQFMSENQLPFNGKFEANMPSDQKSNTGMIGVSSPRGQIVQENQFRNDNPDGIIYPDVNGMQRGNTISGGIDGPAIFSVQNNMQPTNDNFGPPNWDIRVRQAISNGNINMPNVPQNGQFNLNGQQNMQDNLNTMNGNMGMSIINHQQVARNQDTERVKTGIIDQGSQLPGANGQPVGDNVAPIMRNGRLIMSNSPQPVSGNNMITDPNTFNNQFVGQNSQFTQPIMNGNMDPRVQNGRAVNLIGQPVQGEEGPDGRSVGTFPQGNQVNVLNGQLMQNNRPGIIGTIGENGHNSNLNGPQVLGMQQSINGNIGLANQGGPVMTEDIRGASIGTGIIGSIRPMVGPNNAPSPWNSQSGISNAEPVRSSLGQLTQGATGESVVDLSFNWSDMQGNQQSTNMNMGMSRQSGPTIHTGVLSTQNPQPGNVNIGPTKLNGQFPVQASQNGLGTNINGNIGVVHGQRVNDANMAMRNANALFGPNGQLNSVNQPGNNNGNSGIVASAGQRSVEFQHPAVDGTLISNGQVIAQTGQFPNQRNQQSGWGSVDGITRTLGQGNSQNQPVVNPLNGNVASGVQLPQAVNIKSQFQNMNINSINTRSDQSIGPNGNIANNFPSANIGQSQPPQPMVNSQMLNAANAPMSPNSQNINPAIQNQGTRFNQPMTPHMMDNQMMNNQMMNNQKINSVQPINMQGMNLNQQMNNPGVNGMNSQVRGPQGNAMFNQINSQGMMQLPNGPGIQMNNMGLNQPSNGQTQAFGQQNNPWMMQGNFQNQMNGIPHTPNDPFTMNFSGGNQRSTNMNLIPQQNNNMIRNFDGSFGPPMQQQQQQQSPFFNMGPPMPMPFNG